MEVTISAVVKHGAEGRREIDELLTAFRDMVNYAIKRGLEKGYSLKNSQSLRSSPYTIFKNSWEI